MSRYLLPQLAARKRTHFNFNAPYAPRREAPGLMPDPRYNIESGCVTGTPAATGNCRNCRKSAPACTVRCLLGGRSGGLMARSTVPRSDISLQGRSAACRSHFDITAASVRRRIDRCMQHSLSPPRETKRLSCKQKNACSACYTKIPALFPFAPREAAAKSPPHNARASPFAQNSRSLNFWILPEPVNGKLSTKNQCFGVLWWASAARM